ncbi:unnamed protein product, partial [Discosporangium mesarthrocarpum]
MHELNDLTLHQMRTFLAITEAASFSRAAVVLGVTQSALSRITAQMEQTLGAKLFDRSGRGVTLTDSGRLMHEASIDILRRHDVLCAEVQEMSGDLRGECRVAMPESVGRILFLPLIRRMRERHPNCAVRILEAFSADVPDMMQKGHVDVAVVTDTHPHHGLDTELFAEEALYLVGDKSAELVQAEEIKLTEIGNAPLLLYALGGGMRSLIDAAFTKAGLSPQIA